MTNVKDFAIIIAASLIFVFAVTSVKAQVNTNNEEAAMAMMMLNAAYQDTDSLIVRGDTSEFHECITLEFYQDYYDKVHAGQDSHRFHPDVFQFSENYRNFLSDMMITTWMVQRMPVENVISMTEDFIDGPYLRENFKLENDLICDDWVYLFSDVHQIHPTEAEVLNKIVETVVFQLDELRFSN